MLMLHQILDTLYNFHVIKQNIFFNVNIFQIYIVMIQYKRSKWKLYYK